MMVSTSGSGDPAEISFRILSTDSFCAPPPRDRTSAGGRIAFSMKRPFLRRLIRLGCVAVGSNAGTCTGQNKTRPLPPFLPKVCGYVTCRSRRQTRNCRPGLKHYFKPEHANLSRFRVWPNSLTPPVGRALPQPFGRIVGYV